MKKFLLAGASTLALLGFASSASAQLAVDVELGENITELFDAGNIGGVYINAAVAADRIDGSVNITAVPLVAGLNASRVGATVEGSTAIAVALGGIDADLDLGAGSLGIGVDGVAFAAAGANQLALEVVGNRISSTGVLATTAIGGVNDGTIALGALSTRQYGAVGFRNVDGGSLDASNSASDSASNTSNTAARAAAATASLLIEGADETAFSAVSDLQSTGPVASLAANVAANLDEIDGSVNLTGATINDIAGTATTAIGAVNTGTISNGLPGSITIVAGQTTSTTNNNTTVTTPPTTTTP